MISRFRIIFLCFLSIITSCFSSPTQEFSAYQQMIEDAARTFGINPRSILLHVYSANALQGTIEKSSTRNRHKETFILRVDARVFREYPQEFIRYFLYSQVGHMALWTKQPVSVQPKKVTFASLRTGLVSAIAYAITRHFSVNNYLSLTAGLGAGATYGYFVELPLYRKQQNKLDEKKIEQAYNEDAIKKTDLMVCQALFDQQHLDAILMKLLFTKYNEKNVEKAAQLEQFLTSRGIDVEQKTNELIHDHFQILIKPNLERALNDYGRDVLIHILRHYIRLKAIQGNVLSTEGIMYADIIRLTRTFVEERIGNLPQAIEQYGKAEVEQWCAQAKETGNDNQLRALLRGLKSMLYYKVDTEFDDNVSLEEQINRLKTFLTRTV